jgi:hypothetical protein
VTTTPETLRDASREPARELFRCQCCGRDVVTAIDGLYRNPQPGSPRRFCDPACRQAAYRRRLAGVDESTPAQRDGGRRRRLRAGEEVTPLAE